MTETDTLTMIITALVAVVGAAMSLTATQETQIVTGIVAVVGAVLAYFAQNKTKTVVAAMTSGTVESQTPEIIKTLPSRSWKMSDETKMGIVMGANAANKATILSQIDAAEAAYKTHYLVDFNGGYFVIDYGLVQSSMGEPSGQTAEDPNEKDNLPYQNPLTKRWWSSWQEAYDHDTQKPPALNKQ